VRRIIAIVLLTIVVLGIALSLTEVPFGTPKTHVGDYYVKEGVKETGAVNIVTSVVLNYRGFDTLGEVTVLFIATIGLGALLTTHKERKKKRDVMPASLILSTGCRFLFPLLHIFGIYIIIHGHLSPGGGFQGGAIIASAFLLTYLGCQGVRISERRSKLTESLGGLVFVIVGVLGLIFGGYFLLNFLPKGTPFSLLSAGIIPIIYVAIGFKVGSELVSVIDNLMEGST